MRAPAVANLQFESPGSLSREKGAYRREARVLLEAGSGWLFDCFYLNMLSPSSGRNQAPLDGEALSDLPGQRCLQQ